MASSSEDAVESVVSDHDDDWLTVDFQGTGQLRLEASSSTSSLLFAVQRGDSDGQLVIGCSDVDKESGDVKDSWQMTCSLEKVEEKHSELASLFPVIRGLLPATPKRRSGLLSYLIRFEIPVEFCKDLAEYLQNVTIQCGKEMILETFFGVENPTASSFLVSLVDFNKSKVAGEVEEIKKTLQEAIEMREHVTVTDELAIVYDVEDEAMMELDKQELKLADIEEGPFADLRDIEQRQRHFHCQKSLDASLSLVEQIEFVGKERESHEEYLRAQSNLLDLQEVKYEAMVERTQQCIQRMLDDKDKFGDAWEEYGADRLKRMEEKMVIMTVELLKVRCKQLRLQKDRKLNEIATVEESDKLDSVVKNKEREFYELHIKWIEVTLMLLEQQEKQVMFEIDREMDSGKLKALKEREAKLSSKRSKFRNKKRYCDVAAKRNSYQWIYKEESAVAKQAGQKRQEAERVGAEKLKQQKAEERKRTLDRIHMYKEKYPTPVVKKPPRYLPPSQLKPKTERKKTPAASSSSIMSSSMASIRASAGKDRTKERDRHGASKTPPAIPPPPAAVEARLAALSAIDFSTLPPPPPPPPPPSVLPPTPPALPAIKETSPPSSLHVKPKPKPSPAARDKKQTQTVAPGVFDARSILAARKSLKVTGLSGALAGGVNEMKVLLRAGVKEGDDSSLVSKASISDKNAQALSAALDRMKPFTSGDSDESNSSDDDDDDDD